MDGLSLNIVQTLMSASQPPPRSNSVGVNNARLRSLGFSFRRFKVVLENSMNKDYLTLASVMKCVI